MDGLARPPIPLPLASVATVTSDAVAWLTPLRPESPTSASTPWSKSKSKSKSSSSDEDISRGLLALVALAADFLAAGTLFLAEGTDFLAVGTDFLAALAPPTEFLASSTSSTSLTMVARGSSVFISASAARITPWWRCRCKGEITPSLLSQDSQATAACLSSIFLSSTLMQREASVVSAVSVSRIPIVSVQFSDFKADSSQSSTTTSRKSTPRVRRFLSSLGSLTPEPRMASRATLLVSGLTRPDSQI